MERQGKQALEQALKESAKERERQTISKRWTKREEADFFRVVSSYGVIYHRKTKKYDWSKFKQSAKLEKKADEELTEYYKHFVIMCKKQTGIHIDDGSYDSTIEHVSEEKGRRTLERLELLSRIREEILTHPKLDERLQVCVTSADMPDWWVAGKHDKELLIGVGKYVSTFLTPIFKDGQLYTARFKSPLTTFLFRTHISVVFSLFVLFPS